jgi:16S rRNA G966 N2-methylase RsmD
MTVVANRIVGHENVEPDQLLAHPMNARRHPSKQLDALDGSLATLGWLKEVIVNTTTGRVLDGHARIQKAMQTGSKVPVTYVEISEKEELLALATLDKISEMATYDEDALNALLADVPTPDDAGLKSLLAEMAGESGQGGASDDAEEDAVPEPPADPITKPGDLWILGEHRLLCGDATKAEDVARVMDGQKPQMIYTDPPYGISIVSADSKIGGDKAFGKVGGIHKGMKAKPIIQANTYPAIIGDDRIDTAVAAFSVCSTLGAKVMIFWGGNYYADKLPASSCWIVWDKDNGESFFADAELAWTNQKTAVRIFKHQWNGLIKASERGEKRVHPTQKPVALAAWCFDKYGAPGDRVLDLFGGSGSTLIACEQTGRICHMMELAPAYCDVIKNRWEQATGKTAELERKGP